MHCAGCGVRKARGTRQNRGWKVGSVVSHETRGRGSRRSLPPAGVCLHWDISQYRVIFSAWFNISCRQFFFLQTFFVHVAEEIFIWISVFRWLAICHHFLSRTINEKLDSLSYVFFQVEQDYVDGRICCPFRCTKYSEIIIVQWVCIYLRDFPTYNYPYIICNCCVVIMNERLKSMIKKHPLY